MSVVRAVNNCFHRKGRRVEVTGLFDTLLSTVTGGLIQSHDERVQAKAQNAASDLAGTQAAQYGNLYGQGQDLAKSGGNTLSTLGPNPFLQLLQTGGTNNPLLQMYGQTAGLAIPGVSMPPGYIPGTPGGGFTNGVPNVSRPGVAGGPVSPSVAGAQPSNGPGGTNTPTDPFKAKMDAYGLSQPQQVQANKAITRIHQTAQSHISQFAQHLSTQGVSPSLIAEGQARLQAEYDGLAEGTLADFAESARKEKEASLQSLMSLGLSAYEAEQAFGQQQQSTGLQTEANATAGLSNPQGAQQQIGQQAAAQSAANNAALMQLATAFLPGGAFAGAGLFGGAGATGPIAGQGGNILGGIAGGSV